MDHIQLIDSIILRESRQSQLNRDALHPHASGALLCPRRNILQWMELANETIPQIFGDALDNSIKAAIAPEPKVPGVFTVGHIFDRWAKDIYRKIAENDSSIQIASGVPHLFSLPVPEEEANTANGEAILIAGEYDVIAEWGGDTKMTDLIDFKTCKTLYQYEKKGPSMHHIAQISVYAYGLMVKYFDSTIIKPEQIQEFKQKMRLILLYIEKNAAEMLAFHVQLFPLSSLRKYFSGQQEYMRNIRKQCALGPVTRNHLPSAIPSFDWECKWKSGSCKYYETFCKEEQNALRGTIARAQARARDDHGPGTEIGRASDNDDSPQQADLAQHERQDIE